MFSKWININILHFLIYLLKMTSYNIYPSLPLGKAPGPGGPSAPPEAPLGSQVGYHLNIVQAKQRGLKNKEQMFKQKYEKYNKILNRLTWLNACSSRISAATEIYLVSQHSLHSSGFL